jgi:hypothetical protein
MTNQFGVLQAEFEAEVEGITYRNFDELSRRKREVEAKYAELNAQLVQRATQNGLPLDLQRQFEAEVGPGKLAVSQSVERFRWAKRLREYQAMAVERQANGFVDAEAARLGVSRQQLEQAAGQAQQQQEAKQAKLLADYQAELAPYRGSGNAVMYAKIVTKYRSLGLKGV